ncbi:MAG: ribosome-associated translation inhibitor RaiA [Patescibacteria group bacterium]|jgi:putative sigma-54 modulation protein
MIFSAKNFKLTPSLQAYAEEKFGALVHLSRKPLTQLRVRFDVDKNQKHGNIFRVEVSALWQGKTYKAGEKADEMYAAVDLAVEKLQRQLRDAKERGLSARVGHHGLH